MKFKALILFLGMVLVLAMAGSASMCTDDDFPNDAGDEGKRPNSPTATQSQYCAPGCTWQMTFNGNCDPACDNPSCDYDNGRCRECAPGCTFEMINNAHCDPSCNNQACDWDEGWCSECAPGCGSSDTGGDLGNDYCDPECNNAACNYDNGDCITRCNGACEWKWVGDGECDAAYDCNVAACRYDGGDCN